MRKMEHTINFDNNNQLVKFFKALTSSNKTKTESEDIFYLCNMALLHIYHNKQSKFSVKIKLLQNILIQILNITYKKSDDKLVFSLLMHQVEDHIISTRLSDVFIELITNNPSFIETFIIAEKISYICENNKNKIDGLYAIIGKISAIEIRNNNKNIQAAFEKSYIKVFMKKTVICSQLFEDALNIYRKHLLMSILKKGECSASEEEQIFCIAVQQYHKGYAMYYSDEELNIINQFQLNLESAINESRGETITSLYLLLYCMYESLDNIKKIYQVNRKNLPSSCVTILSLVIDSKSALKSIAKSIQKITPISPGVSEVVRTQYEENPYPRWQHTTAPTFSTLEEYINNYCNSRPTSLKLVDNPKILVAGCGTGQHPITLALSLPKAKITAIDLSLMSLAYAQVKAKEHSVKNITFNQADITMLDCIAEKFDFIDCCGVLHHLEDPEKGLSQLVTKLADKGVIRLALYSKIARKKIEEHRQHVIKSQSGTSLNSIRNYRSSILNSNQDNSDILSTRDFYSTSECRDLVFHTHEKSYSWLDIKLLTEKVGLRIVTVASKPEVASDYSSKYPNDPKHNNMANWHEYECSNPNTFIEMMVFWLIKKELHS